MLTWNEFFAQPEQESRCREARQKAEKARAKAGVCPQQDDVFNAFKRTEFENVKAVILGQDPYHGKGQAHGLAFSVRRGAAVPRSLQNIYKELDADIPGFKKPNHGCLEGWAEQGVLLLNTVLTVEEGKPKSHAGFGWETLTDSVIKALSARHEGLVFLLWGKPAQEKIRLIDNSRHHILTAAHPSPLSARRGFFGCRHFSKTNALLEKQGKAPIDWRL